MSAAKINSSEIPPVPRAWQAVRSAVSSTLFTIITLFCLSVLSPAVASAQIYDSLDAYPPRWHLDSSDCDARVVEHKHLVDGGVDGRPCETLTVDARHGSEILFAYPIEPVLPIDGLTANVSVMSAIAGARIGFRVRFPYLREDHSRQAVSVVVFGASYNDPGRFASIGVGMIEASLMTKEFSLRQKYGSAANLKDPYVDAVIVDAYTGAGLRSLRIDELRVDGLVSVSEVSPTKITSASDRIQTRRQLQNRSDDLSSNLDPTAGDGPSNAFPFGRVTRILEHNGEPLAWVRSLGFDAVLLSHPPNSEILSEAIHARVALYCPPPTAPDPSLTPLLQPVAGWYIGYGTALDSLQVGATEETSRRLRAFPAAWQRPIIAAPSESFPRYAKSLDGIVYDLPIRSRGVTDGEEVKQFASLRKRVGDQMQIAAAVMSMSPEVLMRQTESIADSIGAPRPTGFRWHSMWLQAMRSLQSTPSAILYRSTRSLVAGSEMDNQRSMALSYVNRMTAMLEPWIAGATSSPPIMISGAPYRCSRLTKDGVEVLILTSSTMRGSEVLAGDGQSIELKLSPSDATRTFWRMTHFSAERLTPETSTTGTRIEIVSPDAAEVIVVSSDPAIGATLSRSASRFAKQAALDRWQLASDLVRRTQDQWQTAVVSRVTSRSPPSDLIEVARKTLADAEPLYRAGETEASIRMARRADAWALRSEWQLSEALMPDWPRPTSCPPIDCGAAEVQAVWYPLMRDRGWSHNYLTTGSLDSRDMIAANRWTFGKRFEDLARSEVLFAGRGSYEGPGALTARTVSLVAEPLPGGFEGTVLQVRSPAVRVAANTAIRIDALVRTIGFGGAHQGVLVYDSVGGQEMGVLVRGRPTWTPIRLYRQTTDETEVSVMFELMGDGEAMIDEVEVRVWQPD